MTPRVILLAQAFYGVNDRRFKSLETDDDHRARHGDTTRERKDPPMDPNMISKDRQPLIHDQPGNGCCQEKGYKDQFQEVDGQKPDDPGNGRSHHLSDADLLCP